MSVVHPGPYLPPQPSNSLLGLSNELVELVVTNIELPQHLLSLAKTCRSLYALIVPNHLSFRDIDTHIYRNEIWSFLAEKPILAANVRILGLRDTNRQWRECIPTSHFKKVPLPLSIVTIRALSIIPTDNQIASFFNALRQMHNLCRLTITVSPEERSGQLQHIFNALHEAHIHLTELSLTYYSYTIYHPKETMDKLPMPINQLPYLRSLAVSLFRLPKSFYEALTNNSAAHLSSIYIRSEQNDILGLLTVHWPQLRHFSITVIFPGHIVMPENFLRLHANLETLWIVGGTLPSLMTLSRLRSLHVANAFDDPDIDLFPNIRHLSGYLFDRVEHRTRRTYCLDSLRDLPLLESCQFPYSLSTESIALFLIKAPNIKKLSLYLPFRRYDFEKAIRKQEATKVANKLLVYLAHLKNLTHLAGVLVNPYLEVTTPRCSPILKEFATKIPSLVYLQVLHSGRTEWAYIKRDADGAYLGHTYINRFLKNAHKQEWGGFYFGGLKDSCDV